VDDNQLGDSQCSLHTYRKFAIIYGQRHSTGMVVQVQRENNTCSGDTHLFSSPCNTGLGHYTKHLTCLNRISSRRSREINRHTTLRKYGSCDVNSGRTYCTMNCSILPLTLGWRMMKGPRTDIIVSAPKRWAGVGFLYHNL
jgi:hypothetical protein